MLLAAAVALGGCTPGPAPKPTPTPLFTSEADAFKAAEKVYREYTEAGNAKRRGDPSADPEIYLGGSALNEAIQTARKFSASGLTVSGEFVVQSFSGASYTPATDQIVAAVCLDVRNTRVTNKVGADVTPGSRSPVVPIDLQFNRSRAGLVITKSSTGTASCAP